MFHRHDGSECTVQEWIAEGQDVVGYDRVEVNGADVVVFSRFCGLSGQIYETGVDGDPDNDEHAKYRGKLFHAVDRDTCAAKHAEVLASIQAGEDI